MQKYLDQAMEFFRDEAGATSVEYALLASLIAAVIAGSVGALGTIVKSLFIIPGFSGP